MVRNGNVLQLNDIEKLFTTGITHVQVRIKKESLSNDYFRV